MGGGMHFSTIAAGGITPGVDSLPQSRPIAGNYPGDGPQRPPAQCLPEPAREHFCIIPDFPLSLIPVERDPQA